MFNLYPHTRYNPHTTLHTKIPFLHSSSFTLYSLGTPFYVPLPQLTLTTWHKPHFPCLLTIAYNSEPQPSNIRTQLDIELTHGKLEDFAGCFHGVATPHTLGSAWTHTIHTRQTHTRSNPSLHTPLLHIHTLYYIQLLLLPSSFLYRKRTPQLTHTHINHNHNWN